MSYMRIFRMIKYMKLHNENEYKNMSLEDNVYFTLRDIFLNASYIQNMFEANQFNSELTNNVYYEDRDVDFCYTNVLYDKKYVEQLVKWLSTIKLFDFEFEDMISTTQNNEKEIDCKEYIRFDDWLINFDNLKRLLNTRLSELT